MSRKLEGFRAETPQFPHKYATTAKAKHRKTHFNAQKTISPRTPKIFRPKTEMKRANSNLISTQRLIRLETATSNRLPPPPPTTTVQAAIDIEDIKPDEWLTNYERAAQSNRSALLIQVCWRVVCLRRKFSKVYNKNITVRRSFLSIAFNAWRAYASSNIDVIHKSYNKVIELGESDAKIVVAGEPNPFPIFYLTGRFFYPKSFLHMKINPNMFMHITRTFMHPEGKHILQLWHRTVVSRRCYREKCHTFLHTVQKVQSFGNVFIAFVLWHRYTILKKDLVKGNDAFTRKYPEDIIEWRAWVKFLNIKKAKKNRAYEAHVKNVRKRAYMAIHQNLVEKRQYMADLSSSHNFYLRRIQETAKRSWLKFIEFKKQQRTELLKLQRSWYTIAYWNAKKTFTTETYINYSNASMKNLIFFKWRRETKIQKLLTFKSAAKLIEKPSIGRQFIFKLMKLESFIIFEKAWKEWINFTRKRHAFKEFMKTFKKREDNREIKQIALYSLKRAADGNLVKRLVHPGNKFFPYRLMISLEGTKKDYNETKDKAFKPYTEGSPEVPQIDIFNRLVLLVIDNVKHFETAKFTPKKERKEQRQTIEVIPFEEIREVYKDNCKKIRKAMTNRMIRDRAIIQAIDTHFAAIQLSNAMSNFAYSVDFKIEGIKVGPIRRIDVIPGTFESIKVHMDEAVNEKYVQLEWISNYIRKQKEKFNAKVRNPSLIYRKQDMIAESAKLDRNSKHQTNDDPKTSTAVLVPFELAKPHNGIPFNNPSIGCLKKMKEMKMDKMHVSSNEARLSLTIGRLKPKIENLDPVTSLKIFFLAIAGIKLDIKNVAQPEMEASVKRIYRRNLAAFVASFMGYDVTTSVPTGIDSGPLAGYIKAINGAYNSLKQYPSIFSFCGDIPFSEKFGADSENAIDIRMNIYSAILRKYPKMEYRERSFMGDEMSINDMMITAIMLPYIFRPELVCDFIKEELKSAPQNT